MIDETRMSLAVAGRKRDVQTAHHVAVFHSITDMNGLMNQSPCILTFC